MPQHRVAVIQAGTTLFDTPRTLERMSALCEEARHNTVELAVFPEAYIGGYPKGLDFGARVGTRSEAGRDDYLRYWKAAIEVPGPECRTIGSFAAKMKAHLVTGIIERDGGSLYCAVLFFAPDGSLLGKRRKLMPTASERLIWGQGDGSTLPVFNTDIGKIGAAICWENYLPPLRQTYDDNGTTSDRAPAVEGRRVWQRSRRLINYEGRTFVLSGCQYLTRADAPEDYACQQGNDPKTTLIRGGSVIIDPMGTCLTEPVYDREAVIWADIDTDQAIRGKYDLDVAGHYARPDVFSLTVNETPFRTGKAACPAASEPASATPEQTPQPDTAS